MANGRDQEWHIAYAAYFFAWNGIILGMSFPTITWPDQSKKRGTLCRVFPENGIVALAGIINQILLGDREVPKKWRYTATRIFERLRDEHGCQEDAKKGTMRSSK